MNRALTVGFGLLYVLAPDRIVETAERVAFENPEDGRLRPWTLPMARLEGLAFCGLALRGDGFPRPLRAPFALLGVLLATAPRRMMASGLKIAYENPEELEVKSWVVPATRALGALYLVFVLFTGRVDAPEDERGGAERSTDR